MHKPNHIYLVFNPFLNEDSLYQSQAHEFYYTLKNKYKDGDLEKAFMYWGKLSVTETDVSSVEKINEIIKENQSFGEETHVYISDYHHFWVGKLESAHKEVCGTEHILPFYDNKEVATWLKITDFDLISSEFEETLFYLQQLYCDDASAYTVCPIDKITPYVHGVQFPLIVQDRSSEKYFSGNVSGSASKVEKVNALIENPKTMGEVHKQVKSFVLSPQTYRQISRETRELILSAEALLIHQSGDGKNTFSKVLNNYLMAFEVTISNSLGDILRQELGHCLYINESGNALSEQAGEGRILLGDFSGVIKLNVFTDLLYHAKEYGNISFENLLKYYGDIVTYFKSELVPFIEKHEIQSKLQHLNIPGGDGVILKLHKSEIMSIRNEILGVGTLGILNNLMNLMSELKRETSQQIMSA